MSSPVAIRSRTVLASALLLLACGSRAEARPAVGLSLEADAALRALTDSRADAAACKQRRSLAEAVVGPTQIAALGLRLGDRVPPGWLEATEGPPRFLALADDPAVPVETGIAALVERLGADGNGLRVGVFAIADAGLPPRQLPRIEEAEVLLRERLPGVRLVRALDSRLPACAASLWPADAAAGFDECGVEIVYGHPACTGPRDVGAELDALRAQVPEGKPLAVTRLAIATACDRCGARFPEEAAQRAATILARLTDDDGLSAVILDSSDPPSVTAGPSFGLFSSGTVSDALAGSLGSVGGGEGPGRALPPPRVQDPTALWVALTVCLGIGALVLAVALAARIRAARAAPTAPAVAKGWRVGGVAMLLGGAALLTYPWWTDQLARRERTRTVAPLARDWFHPAGAAHALAEGCAPPFSLAIPALGLSLPVGEGADEANLRSGPMHYTGTALPGEPSNCCVAGHRSTYGAPFRQLLDLEPGDELTISGGGGFRRTYRVAWSRVSPSADGRYLAPTEIEALTLSTCHPYGLASERLMVRAYPGDAGDAAARCLPLDERLASTRPAVLLASGLAVGEGAWFEVREPPAPVSPSDAIEWLPDGAESGLGPANAWPPPPLLGPDGAGRRRPAR